MSQKIHIKDGTGTSSTACVDVSNSVYTITTPAPPFGQEVYTRLFRQHLTADGTASGSNDMTVDGSSTNQTFFISADDEDDLWISRIDFLIADAGADNNQFGNITALSNGCKLSYEDDLGEVIISDELTTNFSFVRLCGGNPAFGDTTNTFRASNIVGASEGYLPSLDFKQQFGMPWGIRLKAGTNQRLSITIRDNVSAIDAFNAIAYGFTRAK